MTEPINDQIRDLLGADGRLARAADSGRRRSRAAGPDGRSSAPRRTGVWLAAACVIAVVAGFVVFDRLRRDRIRTSDDTFPATSLEMADAPAEHPHPDHAAPATTGAGDQTTSTTTPEDGPVWRGGLLDDTTPIIPPAQLCGRGRSHRADRSGGLANVRAVVRRGRRRPRYAKIDRVEHNDDRTPAGGTTGPRIELSLSRPGSTQGAVRNWAMVCS